MISHNHGLVNDIDYRIPIAPVERCDILGSKCTVSNTESA